MSIVIDKINVRSLLNIKIVVDKINNRSLLKIKNKISLFKINLI